MRYERKYRIEGLSPQIVLQSIMMHPAGFRFLYPKRQVNNVYFDSPGFQTYKDNIMGLSDRKKFRVRWYGTEKINIEKAQFEIKFRKNEVGDKKIFELNSFTFLDINSLVSQVHQLYPDSGKSLRPTLYNSYQRIYMTTPDQKFRLTLDTELKFAPMMPEPYISKKTFQEEWVSILELKYEEDLDNMADRITQYFSFRRSKNSKYVTGIDYCYK